MFGYKIFAHSIRMVVGQWRQALMISAFLYVVASLVSMFLLVQMMGNSGEGPNGWVLFPSVFVGGFVFIWIAVGWHRYILLDEAQAGFLPQLRGDRVWAYFCYILLTSVIAALIGLVGMIVLFGVSAATGSPWVIGGGIVGLVPLVVITYRLAPLLPAAALGKETTIGKAWASTRGTTWTFLALAIIGLIASIGIDLPIYLLPKLPAGEILSLIWGMVTGWLKLMVGVSILTTIYGHYVEGRAVD